MKYAQKLLVLAGTLAGAAVFLSYDARSSDEDAMSAAQAASGATLNQVTVIYDAFGKDPSMQKDWGFAALIEAGGKRILFDTGNNSEIFAHNVKAKGIDLSRLDFVVVSHRHGDHIGGLDYLLSVNPDVAIYTPKENFGVLGSSFPGTFYRRNGSLPSDMRYFDGTPPETLRFGTPWPHARFTNVAETTEVAPGFHLIVLKGSWGVDLDVMEISLAIDTPEGIVVIVGCGHPTIEKIIAATKAATDKPIHLVVGGLHLLPAEDAEAQRIATVLREQWKVEWIAPGHCTGEPAFEILQKTFRERYLYAGLGTTITFGPIPVTGARERASYAFFDETDFRAYREFARLIPDTADHRLSHADYRHPEW